MKNRRKRGCEMEKPPIVISVEEIVKYLGIDIKKALEAIKDKKKE